MNEKTQSTRADLLPISFRATRGGERLEFKAKVVPGAPTGAPRFPQSSVERKLEEKSEDFFGGFPGQYRCKDYIPRVLPAATFLSPKNALD